MTEILDKKYQKIMVKDFLTQNEFLIYIGKGQEALERFVRDDKLPYYDLGGKEKLYGKDDWKEFMQRFKKGGEE